MLLRRIRRLYKTAQAVLAQTIFGFPGRKLRVIGVTGTDGKTTTAHLIIAALESAGYTVGAVSTIHYQVGTRKWTNASKLTTPGPWALAGLLAHMVRAGCHYVVLECSSHRLDQGGLWGIPFDVAVITNISREHFDYHRTFEDYTRAKERLFDALRHRTKVLPYRSGIDRGGRIATVAVANLDDERTREIMRTATAERKYGFTLAGVEGRVSGVGDDVVLVTASTVGSPNTRRPTPDTLYTVRAGDREALLNLKLPGVFNLHNALAAIAVGVSQDIDLARITRELSEVEQIPGRMDRVDAGQPFTIIIDYAVTPAAFESLYAEMRNNPTAHCRLPTASPRIIHVFGSAGGRDRGKRPILGEIAGKHADLVILTDEDPFNEDPDQILDDIERGLRSYCHPEPANGGGRISASAPGAYSSPTAQNDRRCVYRRIRDRKLAIREALKRAKPGDIVLVTGKGAEETMAVGSQRHTWNDRRVVEEEIGAAGTRP